MKQNTTTDSPRQVISADSVGAQIGPLLAGSPRWRIAQIYRHCFHCLSETGDAIIIGDAHIDRGPFTITCSDQAVTVAITLTGNRDIQSHDNTVLLDDRTAIDTARAAPWLADFNNCAGSGAFPDRVLFTLIESAACSAPRQSFGTLIPAMFAPELHDEQTSATTTALHRRLLRVIDSVRRESAFEDPERLTPLLTPLIGLGYGLTPSGDDFCAGCVLSLVAVGKTEQAAALAAGLFRAAQSRTTVISLAFYRALAASWLSESHARLLRCLATRQSGDLDDALRGVYRHGATSGWDMLAGFAFGIGLLSMEIGFLGWLALPDADS